MALAGDLGRAGHAPESVRTVAMVRLDKGESGFAITGVDLDAEARVPEIESDRARDDRAGDEGRTARSAGLSPADPDHRFAAPAERRRRLPLPAPPRELAP